MADFVDDCEDWNAKALAIHEVNNSWRPGPSHIYCEECEEEIPQDRREAEPGVRFCVECKTKLEGSFWS